MLNEVFNASIGLMEGVIEYGADSADGLYADLDVEIAEWLVPRKLLEEFAKLKSNASQKEEEKGFGDTLVFCCMNNKLGGAETQTTLNHASNDTEATSRFTLANRIFDNVRSHYGTTSEAP
ncbi:hypothetical protein FSARC_13258 [Fusarium sarcochroum]|uniref:Uncharacterized protein n=1 Tax=Fusarium sarcochroum TaxID=1208366 RepID=A0A8H4T2V8_9HYPO|nr:hypothetical protein FSARC_13258 [Fusarium sarcochroum]